jgi:hypothetical protein
MEGTMEKCFKNLLNVYNEAFQLAYVGYRYPSLREKHREFNSQIDANAAMNLAKRFRQLLNEPKAVTGECSPRDLSSLGEGETCLPRQTQLQPRNGRTMNRVMVTRTVSLPLALGGD